MLVSGIDITEIRTSAQGPSFALGTRGANADDGGTKEYMYVQFGEIITGRGYLCVVDTAFEAEMTDTTSTAPGAGAGRPCGAAQAAAAADDYGWIQVYGRGPLRCLQAAAVGTELTCSATPGAVDDATTSGLEVINGLSLGTVIGGAEATTEDAFFSFPHVGRTL